MRTLTSCQVTLNVLRADPRRVDIDQGMLNELAVNIAKVTAITSSGDVVGPGFYWNETPSAIAGNRH